MGFTQIVGASKKEVIDEITRRQDNENGIWSHERVCLRGNCLWSIMTHVDKKTGTTTRMIYLALLGNPGGGGWGYREMTEFQGPYHHNCPLSLLDNCPLDDASDHSGFARQWRERIRQRAADNNIGRKFAVGSLYALTNVSSEWQGHNIRLTSLRPLRGSCRGMTVRVSRKQLGKIVTE